MPAKLHPFSVLRMAVWLVGMMMLALSAPAVADVIRDCPIADLPYSIDSALVDVLVKPEGKAVLQRELGTFLKTAPPFLLRTDTPAFAAIISPRILAGYAKVPGDTMARMDAALRAIPVSDADRIVRCARYDEIRPRLFLPPGKPRILVFEKMSGFRDGPSVDAAHAALAALAGRNGWSIAFTDRGGVMTAASLRRFDVVVWNNVSGDVLTFAQRAAFRGYIEHGGGYVGIHGSAGDPITFWNWYVDTLVGARFIGHPMKPWFQDARVVVQDPHDPVSAGLPPAWTMRDEWYSFQRSPRASGATIVAGLDETSYLPGTLAMGADHPIVWRRCVGTGRSFYSAIGHLPESYSQPQAVLLLESGIRWAAGSDRAECR